MDLLQNCVWCRPLLLRIPEQDLRLLVTGAGFGVRELAPAFKSGGKPPHSKASLVVGLWGRPFGTLP